MRPAPATISPLSHLSGLARWFAIGCLVVLCDYLQYLAGYRTSDEAAKNDEGGYRYAVRSFHYRARRRLFQAKNVLALIGSFGLIALILVAIFRGA